MKGNFKKARIYYDQALKVDEHYMPAIKALNQLDKKKL